MNDRRAVDDISYHVMDGLMVVLIMKDDWLVLAMMVYDGGVNNDNNNNGNDGDDGDDV